MYTYDYPRPAITVDLVVFDGQNKNPQVLLIERKNEPFKGKLALPGGFVNINELTRDAAVRELKEETSLHFDPKNIRFLKPFEKVNRDPRGRVISFAYTAIANGTPRPTAGDDAAKAEWYRLDSIKKGMLAFDHDDILTDAIFFWGFNI